MAGLCNYFSLSLNLILSLIWFLSFLKCPAVVCRHTEVTYIVFIYTKMFKHENTELCNSKMTMNLAAFQSLAKTLSFYSNCYSPTQY